MAKYRDALPQINGDLFLTDGGIETTLIFKEGFDLPLFAAFDILKQADGRKALKKYYRTYAGLAKSKGVGFILESMTWRASSDWGEQLGYSNDELAQINHQAVNMMVDIRNEFEDDKAKMVISGCIGPRGDGYVIEDAMTAEDAQAYHATQINIYAETEADMITAMTMTYVDEAIGVTRAAQAAGIPVVIAFTVETDGNLPSGMTLKNAIEQVDAATNSGPSYYMINCAHPTHFEAIIATNEDWVKRLRGLRANASSKSHAELDESEELHEGNPHKLGQHYRSLRDNMPQLNVLGGCCGTDHRHLEAIADACLAV